MPNKKRKKRKAAPEPAYVTVPEAEEESPVVVQDYDPLTPDAPLAEPQKVLSLSGRGHRKSTQRSFLDKS